MAGDWIKWCKGLASKREVIVLASKLGRDRHEIAGRLMTLWEWCDDNAADIDIVPGSCDVSLKLGDKPFAFVDALLGLPGMTDALASPEVRWIEARSGGRCVFLNLSRHNGTSAKTRAYEAQKKRRQRAKERPKPSLECPDEKGTPLLFSDPLPEILDSQEFRIRLAHWLRYKEEQGDVYKPAGLTAMISRAANKAQQFGVAAVMDAMERAAANGWAGWDQANSFSQSTNAKSTTSRVGPGQRYRPDPANP